MTVLRLCDRNESSVMSDIVIDITAEIYLDVDLPCRNIVLAVKRKLLRKLNQSPVDVGSDRR